MGGRHSNWLRKEKIMNLVPKMIEAVWQQLLGMKDKAG